ncbi:mandelate racemase/muconate lactonizing enzyme family protein [Haloplanus pelagicus]|jgi:o-succinylbenzoate synthase|uniref:mandelate racemase/muconate lactonizing enzyme family protein n=1 Tax=Haloplanus pelagicus TaxID=2949995 RepID=UPI00203CA127|nr:o-succinylbenzoate synthase [Haloplanus sp. HW8-1]
MNRHEFSLDLVAPLSTARGRIERREGVLVGIGADGVRGVGEATPLPGWTESIDDCRTALDAVADADAIGGLRAVDDPREPLADAPAAITDPLADAPAARHAVESALLDATGRRRDRSLAALLADRPAATVPVNATLGDAPAAETVAAAIDAVDAGVACLKVKVGVGSLDRDVTRLRSVRAAVGSDVALRADANGAWDRETAREAIEALATLDLAYLEQPLPATDLSGHAALRGRGVDIALDETLAEMPPAAILGADAADVVVLKPMALGGPGRAVRTARSARAAGVDPVVTTTVDAAPARTAAVHVAAAIPEIRPCGLATRDTLATDLCPDPVPVEDGAVAVPDGPGVAGSAFDDLV